MSCFRPRDANPHPLADTGSFVSREVEAEHAQLLVRNNGWTGEMEDAEGAYAVRSLRRGWFQNKRGTWY